MFVLTKDMFISRETNILLEVFEDVKMIKKIQRCAGFMINYVPEEEASSRLRSNDAFAVIGVPPRSRKVIQRIIITSRRLPGKTTNPIVHSRTLIVDFPITNLVKGSFIKKKRNDYRMVKEEM